MGRDHGISNTTHKGRCGTLCHPHRVWSSRAPPLLGNIGESPCRCHKEKPPTGVGRPCILRGIHAGEAEDPHGINMDGSKVWGTPLVDEEEEA